MIYGIDANWKGEDLSEQFLDRGIAGVGWRREGYPSVHPLLTRMQVGDVIYIKSYPPGEGLIVKGVGFLRTSVTFADEKLGGTFRRVAWFWRGYEHISVIGERHNARRLDALYEELDPEVHLRVLALLVHAWAASVKLRFGKVPYGRNTACGNVLLKSASSDCRRSVCGLSSRSC